MIFLRFVLYTKAEASPDVCEQGWIQNIRRRGRQPSSGGEHQHIIFTKISEKLHGIEKILVCIGGPPPWIHQLFLFIKISLNRLLLFMFIVVMVTPRVDLIMFILAYSQ